MNKLFGLFLLALAFLLPGIGWATLVSLPSPIYYPNVGNTPNGIPITFTNASLTAAGHYSAIVLSAKEDMVISHVSFRNGTAVGTPTADVRIETVDGSTGLPSGTLWATNTNGVTGTLASDSFTIQAMTASATIPKGSIFCVKIAFNSGTSFPTQRVSYSSPMNSQLPYFVNNTGTPTKTGMDANTFVMALGSSSTTFYQVPGIAPIDSTGGGGFNNGTAGAKRGMTFTLPMNARAIGVRWFQGNNVGAGNYNVVLTDSTGVTVLSSSSTAVAGPNQSGGNLGFNNAYFANTVTLTAGTTYAVWVEPASASNVNISTLVMTNSIYRGAFAGQSTANYATYTTGGGITNTTTAVPLMDLIIDQVDNGAGGGGGRIIGG